MSKNGTQHIRQISEFTVFDEVEREKAHIAYFFQHQRAQRCRGVISGSGGSVFTDAFRWRQWLVVNE